MRSACPRRHRPNFYLIADESAYPPAAQATTHSRPHVHCTHTRQTPSASQCHTVHRCCTGERRHPTGLCAADGGTLLPNPSPLTFARRAGELDRLPCQRMPAVRRRGGVFRRGDTPTEQHSDASDSPAAPGRSHAGSPRWRRFEIFIGQNALAAGTRCRPTRARSTSLRSRLRRRRSTSNARSSRCSLSFKPTPGSRPGGGTVVYTGASSVRNGR